MGKKRKKLPGWAFNEPEWKEYGPAETGLPIHIWIDVVGIKNKGNLRYIRFATWEDGSLFDSEVMTIGENPYIPNGGCYMPTKHLVDRLKSFVIENHEILTAVGMGTIDFPTFNEKLKEYVSGSQV